MSAGLTLKAWNTGYTQHTSLELIGNSRKTKEQVGLWNLVQMLHGGDLLIPTYGRTKPRHIFSTIGHIPAKDLITTDHLILYRMRHKGNHNISIRAASVCGRIGYLYRCGNQGTLIFRNFMVNPSGECVEFHGLIRTILALVFKRAMSIASLVPSVSWTITFRQSATTPASRVVMLPRKSGPSGEARQKSSQSPGRCRRQNSD